MTCSSTAIPREPNRSKNADCGFTAATRGASASTAVRANFSSPLTESVRPQASSRPACGSMPAHSGPRPSIASRSRAPNGASSAPPVIAVLTPVLTSGPS